MALLDTNTLFTAVALVYAVGGVLVYAGRDPLTSRRAEGLWLSGSLFTALVMLCFAFPYDIAFGFWLLPAALLSGLKNALMVRALARLTESRLPWWGGDKAWLLQTVLLLACCAFASSHVLQSGFLLASSGFHAVMAWQLLHRRRKRGPAAMLVGACSSVFAGYMLVYASAPGRLSAWPLFSDQSFLLLSMAFAVIMQIGFIQIQRDLQYRQLSKLAALDPLTGIFNRRTFLDLALRQCALHTRHQRVLSLLIIDLDHFKQINDTYGHSKGDQALRAVADCLADEVRQGDVFARIGGEEFCLLLPDTGLDGAQLVADKLRRAIGTIVLSSTDPSRKLTASIGVAASAADGSISWNQLFETADRRLYLAKSAGRNRVISSDQPPAAPVGNHPLLQS